MEQLIFDDGTREFQVNGGEILRFNPQDLNLYHRFFEAMGEIDRLARGYAADRQVNTGETMDASGFPQEPAALTASKELVDLSGVVPCHRGGAAFRRCRHPGKAPQGKSAGRMGAGLFPGKSGKNRIQNAHHQRGRGNHCIVVRKGGINYGEIFGRIRYHFRRP